MYENYSTKIKHKMLTVISEIQDYLKEEYKDEYKTLCDFQKYYMSLGLQDQKIVLWFKQNDIIVNNPFICNVFDIPPYFLKASVVHEGIKDIFHKLFKENPDLVLSYGIRDNLILYLDYSREEYEKEYSKYIAASNASIFHRMLADVAKTCQAEYYKMITGLENKISISVNGREITEFNMLPSYYENTENPSLFGSIDDSE